MHNVFFLILILIINIIEKWIQLKPLDERRDVFLTAPHPKTSLHLYESIQREITCWMRLWQMDWLFFCCCMACLTYEEAGRASCRTSWFKRDKIRLCAHAHGAQLFCGVQIARHFVAVSSGLARRKKELERK